MTGILVISPLSSHPPQNGARRRIYSLCSFLKSRGHRIHFVYTACEVGNLETRKALMEADWDSVDVFPSGHRFTQSLGNDYGVDDWINPHLLDSLPTLIERYDITHCLTNYVFQSKYLDVLPEGIIKVLDTHDKLSRRHLFDEHGMEPGFFHTTEEEELKGLSRADVILSIQDNEVDYFQRAGKPVVVVGHPEPNAFIEKRYTQVKKLGYIGAANKFNIHALESLIHAFKDHVAATGSDLTLHLAGNVTNKLAERPELQGDCIRFEGFVDSVGDFLEEIDCYINPTLIGTGLKIKSVEALSYGIPVISTATGWDGLPALPGFHDAPDMPVLIDAIAQIEREGFDTLTKLANFSRASFAEYQMNLANNLVQLFETAPVEMLKWAQANPSYIGNRHAENPAFVSLEDVSDHAKIMRDARPTPRIAHVVNPVRMPKTSDLYIAQPIVYRSMAVARDSTSGADVTLIARRFPEDADYQTDAFDLNLPLTRSAVDLDIMEGARKLPLLAEVFSLDGLEDDVTHIVYTNSDIGLQPQFYDFVADQIADGYDALVINRRTLPKRFTSAMELSSLYAELGENHPGFDCFVVSREILEKSDFADTLVGVHLIGRVIFWNLIARANKIGYFPSQSLTFHIGDDVPSKGRAGLPYIRHNLEQGAKVARSLSADPGGFEDSARTETFSRVLRVSPGEIHGKFDPEKDPRNQVLLHSLFRSGSTYLYNKVRAHPQWTAYYEPLHEDLAVIYPENIDDFRERHSGSSFRHDKAQPKSNAKSWLFAEYEPFLDAGLVGMAGYDRRMSYMQDFPGYNKAMKTYVGGLIHEAPTENVFLQFNRTAMRQDQMRRLFPDATHVYLSRHVRDVWGSYLSFQTDQVYGFLRNNLAFLNFNPDAPLSQALSEFVPVTKAPFVFFFHSYFRDAYDLYSLEQHYLIHAAFWYAGRYQAAQNADLVVDLDLLKDDKLAQIEAEARLSMLRLPISFADLDIHSYAPVDLGLSPMQLERLDARARDIAETLYGPVQLPQDIENARPIPKADFPKPDPAPVAARLRAGKETLDQNQRKRFTEHTAELREKAPEPPALPVGARISPIALASSGALLSGFHQGSPDGVWTSRMISLIRFRVEHPQPLRINLDFALEPKMVARGQGVLLFLNGDCLDEIDPNVAPSSDHLILSAAALTQANGIVELGIYAPRMHHGTAEFDSARGLCLMGLTLTDARARQGGAALVV